MPKVWANLKLMIMKKIAVLLFFAISTFACTADDNEMNPELNTMALDTDSTPPTHDPKWGKDKNGIQGD